MSVNIADIGTPADGIQRDSRGRYIIEGKAYTRATTIAGSLDDRQQIEQWKLRCALKGAGLRDEYALQAAGLDIDGQEDKKAFRELAEQCIDIGQGVDKAKLGTALHRQVELVTTGQQHLDDVPTKWRGHVARYLDTLAAAGIEIDPAGVEQVVVCTRYGIAGTADNLPLILPDGRRVVGDLKTGSIEHSWLSISAQMALYANHDHTYDPRTDKLGPRQDVDTDRAIIIHLPAVGDTCELEEVDLRFGWEVLEAALEVKDLRNRAKRKKKDPVHRPYQPIAVGTGGQTAIYDWLVARIEAIASHGHGHDIVNRWPATVPTPLPRPGDLTEDHIAAVERALDNVEAAAQIPFGPTRPGTTTTTNTNTNKKAA